MQKWVWGTIRMYVVLCVLFALLFSTDCRPKCNHKAPLKDWATTLYISRFATKIPPPPPSCQIPILSTG